MSSQAASPHPPQSWARRDIHRAPSTLRARLCISRAGPGRATLVNPRPLTLLTAPSLAGSRAWASYPSTTFLLAQLFAFSSEGKNAHI